MRPGGRRAAPMRVVAAVVCALVVGACLWVLDPWLIREGLAPWEAAKAPDGYTRGEAVDDGSSTDGGGPSGQSADGKSTGEEQPRRETPADLLEGTDGVVSQARQTLEDYQRRGDCLLRSSGYLDLLGNVWGCVIDGGSWVDVVVVRSTPDGGADRSVVRMDAKEWTAELGAIWPGAPGADG